MTMREASLNLPRMTVAPYGKSHWYLWILLADFKQAMCPVLGNRYLAHFIRAKQPPPNSDPDRWLGVWLRLQR